jgi:ABC-type nitrate/sulfonate/bicarbonate transport system substrate-binding protein
MGFWGSVGRGTVWAFARNTEVGRKLLGKETLAEQWAREHREKHARLEGKWASKYVEDARTRKIQLFVDRNGNPTDRYPHVHVIHDEVLYAVTIQVSVACGFYPYKVVLPGSATGNEVNAAIDQALAELSKY